MFNPLKTFRNILVLSLVATLLMGCSDDDWPQGWGLDAGVDGDFIEGGGTLEDGEIPLSPDCDPGLTFCEEQCVGTNNNPLHCGGCGEVCQVGELCVGGKCEPQEGECPETPCTGFTYCDEISGYCRAGCERDTQCSGGLICNTMTHECECPTDFHLCAGKCYSDDDVATCGTRCAPCPGSPNGAAVCVERTCQLECDSGFRLCGGACAACPSDALDTQCDGNQCVANACGQGKRLCDGQCADCPTNHVAETECKGSQCVALYCTGNYGACNGICVPCPDNTLYSSCNQDKCVAEQCTTGYHVCNGTCVDSSSVNHCAGQCTPCPTSPLGKTVCTSAGCSLECNSDAHPCAAGCCSWSVETVDSQNSTGILPSIAFDPQGRAWMAHLDTGQAKVRVSNWTGTAWNNVTVGDANYGTYTYDRPHIATGPGNEVAVAYIKRPENRLMVAKRVGSTWQEQLVDTVGAAGRPEIAFLSTGKRVVFYHTSSQGTHQAFFAEELGSGWDLRFIANVGSFGGRTSMMLGPNDQPHIAFFDDNSGALKYGTRTAGNWSIETAGHGGYSISIALDKNGKPAIAYTTLSPLTIRVATIGSSGYWTSETVDVGSSRPVLAFDESGRAHIAAESDSDRIRYAVRGPTGWDVKTVEVAGEVKTSIGLAVQSTGEAWIPFQSDNQLKVLH